MSATLSQCGQEALASWEDNAAFWDEGIGEHGNKYWKILQEPCLQRMLGEALEQPNCHALDIAAGNGLCSRWLASHDSVTVLATDGSDNMLEQAKKYSVYADKITFSKLDVTDTDNFVPLVEQAAKIGGFDVVLMNMAIMDVSTLEPLAATLPKLLKKGGVFVGTMLHPVFFTSDHSRKIEVVVNKETGQMEIVRSTTIHGYLDVEPARGVAIAGQKTPQFYFHRPLHELFGVFFKNGLVMDALEEPNFTEADMIHDRVEATPNFIQLPALMAFRFRLLARAE